MPLSDDINSNFTYSIQNITNLYMGFLLQPLTYIIGKTIGTVVTLLYVLYSSVKTNLKIPSIKCFDKDTIIQMNDGAFKRIIDIEIGDILYNNNEVTARIKVTTDGSQMYNLNSVVVSDSHMVNYNNQWIPVSEHPNSVKIESYNEPFLYCLNTSSKTIIINNTHFTDWDELYGENIYKFKTMLCVKFNNSINCYDNYCKNFSKNKYVIKNIDIHKYFDGGFFETTLVKLQNGQIKQIKNVNINDVLENGEKVYGLVEINGNDIDEQFIYNLGKGRIFEGGANLGFHDKSIHVLNTLDIDEQNKIIVNKQNKLYHLLTDTKTFKINNIGFFDYNASIDLFLEKSRKKLLSIKYV